jgi:hypothetical protein
MSDLRKSAQMALNHLLSFDPMAWSPKTAEQVYAAITELRAALAQPEPDIEETLLVCREQILRLTHISEKFSARIRALEMQQRSEK